jgi:ATP-dependent helicase/nuclease subunit B
VRTVSSYVQAYIGEIGCDLDASMMYTFSRLRDLALVMAKNVLDEFSDSSFKILAQEMRISEHQSGALRPLEISVDENDDSSPKIILGGIIDRLDFYDGEDRRYLRVVDYKTGHHPFDIDGLENGKDIQLPAYLFTAALEKNKALIGGEKEISPASAIFLSANETKGAVSPERSGFMLNEPELFRAASGELDKKMLAGIDVDKSTGKFKKGNAVSKDDIKQIENTLRNSIATTGRSIFSGRAPRTPSSDACKYCFLRASCPVAAKNTDF